MPECQTKAPLYCHMKQITIFEKCQTLLRGSFKAVRHPHLYHFRTSRIGLPCLAARYGLPSIIVSLLLNIPRMLTIFPPGRFLLANQDYLRLYLLYQVKSSISSCHLIHIELFFQIVHPILSTAILPTLILLILNVWNVRRIRSSSSHQLNRYSLLLKVGSIDNYNTFRHFLLTKMCSIIVTLFIVCNLPRLVVGTFELTR